MVHSYMSKVNKTLAKGRKESTEKKEVDGLENNKKSKFLSTKTGGFQV